ncbi:hypothetical protein D3C85_1372960 [compost metagenome]
MSASCTSGCGRDRLAQLLSSIASSSGVRYFSIGVSINGVVDNTQCICPLVTVRCCFIDICCATVACGDALFHIDVLFVQDI